MVMMMTMRLFRVTGDLTAKIFWFNVPRLVAVRCVLIRYLRW